jgi:hypothetical protein
MNEENKRKDREKQAILRIRIHKYSGGGGKHSGLAPSHAAPLGADPTEGTERVFKSCISLITSNSRYISISNNAN